MPLKGKHVSAVHAPRASNFAVCGAYIVALADSAHQC
jgi:hypothetical protein